MFIRLSEDVNVEVLKCLDFEELCAFTRVSHRMVSRVRTALRRRRVAKLRRYSEDTAGFVNVLCSYCPELENVSSVVSKEVSQLKSSSGKSMSSDF